MTTTKAVAKLAAVATGLAMAASVLSFAPVAQAAGLTTAQVNQIVGLLQAFGADSATLANVQAALTGQPTTTTTTTTTTATGSYTFTKDLTIGSSGADVKALQQALIAKGYLSSTATGYFGSMTKAAVIKWQTAAGVSPASGYFGAKSRAAFTGAVTTGTTGTTTGTGSTGTVTVGSGNGLKVAVAPTSPNGSVLVAGQGIGDIGEFIFSNPTSAAITVTGLTFNRTGVSNDQTIDNVYLYNGVNRLTDSAGVSNSAFSFTNSGGLFTVAAGSTYTVAVRADIHRDISGQQIGASLVSVAQSGTLDSSDSFPINSGYQTISAATLAQVTFSATTQPAGTTISISPQSSYPIWENSVQISGNAVWLKSFRLTNLGSIDASAVTNIRLYVDGTQIGSAVSQLSSDRTVSFDLSASPVSLSTSSHDVKVLADVVGGASRTFQFSLQRSSDAMFVDSQLNQPIVAKVGSQNNTNFSAVTAQAQVTVQAVSSTQGISVTRDPSSQTSDIAQGSTNQKMATFDFLATGENTKVQDLYLCAITTGTGKGSGGLNNGAIYFNGVQVGSTRDIAECTAGTTSSTYTDFSLGSQMILSAGTTAKVDIAADAQNAAGTNLTDIGNGTSTTSPTVQIVLVPGTSNAQGQSSLQSANVPAAQTTGNSVNLTASSLTATNYAAYGNQTMVPGSQGKTLGEFTLSAGTTQGVTVNTISLSLSTAAAAEIQNVKLVDTSTGAQIGTTFSTGQTTMSFSGLQLDVPVSSTKTVAIVGDILSSAISQIQFSLVPATTGGTGDTTHLSTYVPSGTYNLQAISVGSGTLTVALSASNPVSTNVIAGSSKVPLGAFTFSANNSSYAVDKLEVDIPTTAIGAIGTLYLQYPDANGQTVTVSHGITQGVTTSTAAFGLSDPFYIGAGKSADVKVIADLGTISTNNAGLSGTPITVALNHNTNFEAKDASGAATTTPYSWTADVLSNSGSASSGHGIAVIRQSKPNFAGASNGGSAVAPNTSTVIYQFTVSADQNGGPIDLTQFAFTVSTSTVTLSNFKLYDASAPSTALNSGTANIGNTGIVKIPTSLVQVPQGGTTTFILKATPTGWGNGANISINLAPADTTEVKSVGSTDVLLNTSNYVWSDRSLNSDDVNASQWANGFLITDLVDGTYSFTSNN